MSPLYDIPEARIALLDLRGLGKLFGTAEQIAGEIDKRAAAAGLIANVAIAANIDSA